MEADPGLAFFPDGHVNLYGALEIEKGASPEDVRKAYRRLSLVHHPDKAATRPPDEQEAAKARFQRVGFAYAVLSDEKRRARFDRTGRTDQGALDVEPDEGWDAYFAELWDGEVNSQTLTEFFDSYEGSAEELEDIVTAYNESDGDIEHILAHVPARDNIVAEKHLTDCIKAAIAKGSLQPTKRWTSSLKDSKGRSKRQRAAEQEAKEAEAAAKDMGIYDKLYGDGKKSKKGSKAAADGNDEAALKALIQQRGAARMDALIGNLEAKYGKAEGQERKRKGAKKEGNSDNKKARVEPTEEEFQRMQAEVDARRNNGKRK